jgi:hypothetical protein
MLHSKAKATDDPKDLGILQCWFCAVVLRLLTLPLSCTTYPDPVTWVASLCYVSECDIDILAR